VIKPASECTCGGDSKVVDSRPSHDTVRRRRVCLECGRKWTTYEMEPTISRPTPRVVFHLRTS
jgi:transcriptional regulator NrdR family protein